MSLPQNDFHQTQNVLHLRYSAKLGTRRHLSLRPRYPSVTRTFRWIVPVTSQLRKRVEEGRGESKYLRRGRWDLFRSAGASRFSRQILSFPWNPMNLSGVKFHLRLCVTICPTSTHHVSLKGTQQETKNFVWLLPTSGDNELVSSCLINRDTGLPHSDWNHDPTASIVSCMGFLTFFTGNDVFYSDKFTILANIL